MTLPRRTFVRLTAAAVALPAISRLAWAHPARSQPVRIVVGFAPGGASDVIARTLAPSLAEHLGQDVMIDNCTGVGGNVAVETVVRAPADGHILLMVDPSSAINATLYEKLGFDFLRDITPVAGIAHAPNVMLVGPSIHARTVAEFIKLAKDNPDAIRMASDGVGTTSHLAGELFNRAAGIQTVHVAYRGGAGTYADLSERQADVYFPPLASAIPFIRAGTVRPLAVTTAHRQILLARPAAAEFMPGYQASTWFGIGAPKGTPDSVVERLNAKINAALADPKIATQIGDLGGTLITGSSADFGRLIAEETQKWATVLKVSNTAIS